MARKDIKTLIDWQGQRIESRSIPDFVERLTNQVKQLPRNQRAREYANILTDIDPALEPRVRQLAVEIADSSGAPASDALRLATTAQLKARRRFLFRVLFNQTAQRHADRIVRDVMRFSDDPKERALMFDQTMGRLRPLMTPGYIEEQARQRLEETHFPPWFVDWALHERKPTRKEDIQKMVGELIRQGVEPKEAMRRGAKFAMQEFTLENLMALGVASGPDFCIAASVIAALGTVAGIVIPIVLNSVNNRHAEEDARAAQRTERNMPLGIHEIQTVCDGIQSMNDQNLNNWSAVESLVRTYLQTYRYGREELQPDEERQIRECWEEAKAARYAANAEEREEAWRVSREREEVARAQGRTLESEQMLTHLSELQSELDQRRRALQQRQEAALTEVAVQQQQQTTRSVVTVGGVVLGLAALGVLGYVVKKKFF